MPGACQDPRQLRGCSAGGRVGTLPATSPAPNHPERSRRMLERFTWFRQAAFLYRAEGANIYIDPWGVTVDDPADVIFLTHAHEDHFSRDDLERITKDSTQVF